MTIIVPFAKLLSSKSVLFNIYLLIAVVGSFSLIIVSATAWQYRHQTNNETKMREYYLASSVNLEKLIDQTLFSQYWFKMNDHDKAEYTSEAFDQYADEKEIINNLLYIVNTRSKIIIELQRAYQEEAFERTTKRFEEAAAKFVLKMNTLLGKEHTTAEEFDLALAPLMQVSRQLHGIHEGSFSEAQKKLQSSWEASATAIILLISALLLVGMIVVSRVLKQIHETLKARESAEEDIRHLNLVLENRVAQRTHELTNSLAQLHKAQDKLVESEKMAALGGLVAGIAHEINTPLGVSMTANSFLLQKLKAYSGHLDLNSLTREDFESLMASLDESAHFIQTNLERASSLIRSFKQIAVDRSNDEMRRINLNNYLSELVMSLGPEIKTIRPKVTINCDKYLDITCHPGAIAQIITNLVMNSLIHGFADMTDRKPAIEINVTCENQLTTLVYRDNGAGVTEDQIKKIFEPFYTTRRNQGGSGLGMHIVYNLVSQTLGGTIDCRSKPGEGIEFHITIPLITDSQASTAAHPPRQKFQEKNR